MTKSLSLWGCKSTSRALATVQTIGAASLVCLPCNTLPGA